MKLTKSQLKQLIKEELSSAILETKEEHIAGISSKIDRLRRAIEMAEKGMENMEMGAGEGDNVRATNAYFAKQVEVTNLNSKISLLLKQLQQLNLDEPGQLERGN